MNSKHQEAFSELCQNPSEILDKALTVLCNIGDNILHNPLNLKFRTLQKTNTVISNKLLAVKGGKKCLMAMGFEEKATTFVMEASFSLEYVEEFVRTAESCLKRKSNLHIQAPSTSKSDNSNNNIKKESIIRKVKLPPLQLTYSNPFLKSLEIYAHGVLQYEDKALQERTKKIIPIITLEENAQKKLRIIQRNMKKNSQKDQDLELSIGDMLILELLQWFKEDFFSWVDSPSCEFCGQATTFSHMSEDPQQLQYTDRVELHKCQTCKKLTQFPRYNDLNILLETRRGRCGEWANTFTLCCRTMGWDARYVVDQGDHVWTEVYSSSQKRWLHCDPCENICDNPLIYQSGWKKIISYVIAYSAEDVQDVTWRYSNHHNEVLKWRTACSEKQLLEAIFKIRNNLQEKLSAARKNYLLKRCLSELVEFLTEKKAKSDELQGRISGSEAWRLARGETRDSEEPAKHVWNMYIKDITDNSVTIRYSAALNIYEYISGNTKTETITGWEKGAFDFKGVFRKVEKDWNMVYLARKEGEESGSITWKFNFKNCKHFYSIGIQADRQTYENGIVTIKICTSYCDLVVPINQKSFTTTDLAGTQEIMITATFSEGKGDTAWQHAQLFRQSADTSDFNFKITFILFD